MAADWHIRPQPSSPPEVNDSRAPHCGLSSVQSGCRSWVRFDYWTYSHFWHPHVRGGGVNMALTRFRKSLIWLISRRYISWKFEIELPQHERNPNRLSVDETGRRTRRETNALQDGQTSSVHPFAHLSIYLPIRVILKISFDHMKLTQDSDAYIDSYHLRTVLQVILRPCFITRWVTMTYRCFAFAFMRWLNFFLFVQANHQLIINDRLLIYLSFN